MALMGYPSLNIWYLGIGLRQRRLADPTLSVVDGCEGPSMG